MRLQWEQKLHDRRSRLLQGVIIAEQFLAERYPLVLLRFRGLTLPSAPHPLLRVC